ncbi:MAG: MBL fold metallo-hydrolase [Candidatus Bathyarchaeia archaeon]
MRVLEYVHYVECPLYEDFTGVGIIFGEGRIALVDAGTKGSLKGFIFPYLKALGRHPEEIDLAIITHEHGDHFGGLPELREVSKAKVAAHEATKRRLGNGVDMILRDGERLKAGKLELQVLHTPGHSEGSICLYEASLRLLFTGDSVQGNGTIIQGIAIYTDWDAYLRSMERLSELPIETLIAAHRYRPMGKAVLKGEEARGFILESIRQAERYEEALKDLIAERMPPYSVEELNERMCALFAQGSSRPHYGASTIRAYLAKMEKKGKIGIGRG